MQTKLFAPPLRPSLVARPRLLAKLNKGLEGKLNLVSAPAGFGKTTLVSHWVGQQERPAAWLSIDENDAALSLQNNIDAARLISTIPMHYIYEDGGGIRIQQWVIQLSPELIQIYPHVAALMATASQLQGNIKNTYKYLIFG